MAYKSYLIRNCALQMLHDPNLQSITDKMMNFIKRTAPGNIFSHFDDILTKSNNVASFYLGNSESREVKRLCKNLDPSSAVNDNAVDQT